MKIGIMSGARARSNDVNDIGRTTTVDEISELARRCEQAGLNTLWMANVFSLDAIMTMAIAGRESRTLEVGTAVTPTYPRHPTAIAQQAVTAAAACNNRFVLGIGLAHKVMIEDMLGMSYAKPARHMREYLEVLMPLLRGEVVNYSGEQYRVTGLSVGAAGATTVPVVVAALGSEMLKLAGEFTDGTSTWMVGPKTLEAHIIKNITAAAGARKRPRVIAGFPIVLTNEVDSARQTLAGPLSIYGQLPSYRAMLDREGLTQPHDIGIIGNEHVLRSALLRLRDLGVTDFNAAIAEVDDGAFQRTFDFLAGIAGELGEASRR